MQSNILIPNLVLKDGNLVYQIHHEVLSALFNLCKINKRRQEQAAENGIIPHLIIFIMSDSPQKKYALPLLCGMAHASRNSGEQLRSHGGLDMYLNFIDDEYWLVIALDSIFVCLAQDNDNNHKVEQALLENEAIQKLVNFFQSCPEKHFVHILEPFLKIITYVTLLFIIKIIYHSKMILYKSSSWMQEIITSCQWIETTKMLLVRLNLLKLVKVFISHILSKFLLP